MTETRVITIRLNQARWVFAVVVLSLTAFSLVGQRWTLVDRLDALALATGLLSFPWGLWLSFQMNLTGWFRASQTSLMHIAIAMLLGISGIVVARAAVEAIAFWGIDPRPATVSAVVTDHHSAGSAHWKAFVSLGSGIEKEVAITPELNDLLENRPGSSNCLTFTMETGRWGLHRVDWPRPFVDPPLSEDRYAACNGNS